MRFLDNISDEDKAKLIHELSIEYAKKVSNEEPRGVLEGFELHESLLCHYAYVKEQYERDFYSILSKYERAIQDKS